MSDNNPYYGAFDKSSAFKGSFQTPLQEWNGEVEMKDAWLVPYNGYFWVMNNPEDMHEGYDLISHEALRVLGEYSEARIDEDLRLQIVERVGILLDTPEMNDFWSHISELALDDALKRVVDEVIHEAVKSMFERLVVDAGKEPTVEDI